MVEEVYITRDMYTAPPTVVAIIIGKCTKSSAAEQLASSGITGLKHFILESDIIPTQGYLNRHTLTQQLSICFQYSFGKCCGRNHNDSFTCRQIHVDQKKLDFLRLSYVAPLRESLCRTIKVKLTPYLEKVLVSLTHGRSTSMAYFEFGIENVETTKGLKLYEFEYKHWLHAEENINKNHRKCHKKGYNQLSPGVYRNANICEEYTVKQRKCRAGQNCDYIHVIDLGKAIARDGVIIDGLSRLTQQQYHRKLAPKSLWKSVDFSLTGLLNRVEEKEMEERAKLLQKKDFNHICFDDGGDMVASEQEVEFLKKLEAFLEV